MLTNQYLQAMKTAKVKTKQKNYAIPGEPMTQSEFEAHIKEAEKGPFTDWEEGKKNLKYGKKQEKNNTFCRI